VSYSLRFAYFLIRCRSGLAVTTTGF